MSTGRIAPLPDGPLDVVGDVHGEVDALRALLAALGYRAGGGHPDGRRLVFVGDLVDRGPDSPAVVALVAPLCAAGRAQCLLGNHELSLLRGVRRHGNGWFFDADHDRERGEFRDAVAVTPAARAPMLAFFESLPVAAERADLRVVHAAWHAPSIGLFRGEPAAAHSCRQLHDRWAAAVTAEHARSGRAARAAAEVAAHGAALRDPDRPPPLLVELGRCDVDYQMSNPLRVLTSGLEMLAAAPFHANGRWRMVERIPWWRDYPDPVPVVFGHYWRWPSAAARARLAAGNPDPFEGLAPECWLTPRANALCIDYGVGARYVERSAAAARGAGDGAGGPEDGADRDGERAGRDANGWLGRLAALRWPERELVFDDGTRAGLRRIRAQRNCN